MRFYAILNKRDDVGCYHGSSRQVIDSNLLSGVIPLPKGFQNKTVEVIVFLREENIALPPLTVADIDIVLQRVNHWIPYRSIDGFGHVYLRLPRGKAGEI